jgi:DNA-binding transcriptional ArsR family regulator
MLEIADLAQLRALASPMRQALIDTLEASGPCSVAELAELVGRPADSLYYHLRILQKVKLVHETVDQLADGRAGTIIDVVGRPIRIRYDPSNRRGVATIVKAAEGMLRAALRGFRRGFRMPGVCVKGRGRELWASRSTPWLTPEELAEVNSQIERLLAIVARARGSRPGSRPYELTFVLSPVAPRSPTP